MSTLVFSQHSLSCLVRISRLLDKELGFQFKLSSRPQLAELLRASSISPVQEVRQCFLDMIEDMDEIQRDHIISMGVSVPEYHQLKPH